MSEAARLREDDTMVEVGPERVEHVHDAVSGPVRRGRRGSRRVVRWALMVAVPLAIAMGSAYAYLHAGRIVSTENAYVKAHIVNVASEVSGAIVSVAVEENEVVAAGAVLFTLRAEPYQFALARAEAALAQARTDVETDRLAYRKALAEIDQYQAALAYAEAQYKRQVGLRNANLGTVEALDTAKYAVDSAQQQIQVAERQAATLLARLNGDVEAPLADQPRYRQAMAERDQAQLDLARTVVRAPYAGVIKNRPEVGAYVEQGMPIMAVVASNDLWIEANFKETQLTYIRAGQPVEFEVDTYPGVEWRGRVESISEATGAEFALLPPQNATGNWVKVVQRIPLRVAIEPADDLPPLRVGMSSTVNVDTGHVRSWSELLPDF